MLSGEEARRSHIAVPASMSFEQLGTTAHSHYGRWHGEREGERKRERKGGREREKKKKTSKPKIHTPVCSNLAIEEGISRRKAFLVGLGGGVRSMDLYYLWLSGFQIDTINIQSLNSAGSSHHWLLCDLGGNFKSAISLTFKGITCSKSMRQHLRDVILHAEDLS